MTILSIRGVERRFDKTLALQATDLDVAENDFITILGPSGCGKSTLLRIVAGLDHQTAGEVMLEGQRISGPGADRGMVFQSYTLFPWLSVRDNVCFGLVERGMARAQQLEIAAAFIDNWASGRPRRRPCCSSPTTPTKRCSWAAAWW
jgi:ABC-type nitrate/sulfonate/bicarbonate transport system ATPase subunit